MKLDIFQSYSGDCTLLESSDGKNRILSDGGTPRAMRNFISKALVPWQMQGKDIDLLYISHIDSDHIGGALVLLETTLEWRVWDFHDQAGDAPRKPELPRPPRVKRIWHNAFRDLVTENTGAIANLLAASAPVLATSTVPEMQRLGLEYAQIATTVQEALKVSRLLKPDLLDIPLNKLEKSPNESGKLLMARPGLASEQIGPLEVSILCPTAKELDQLRKGWNHWLRVPANRTAARAIRDKYARSLEAGEVGNGVNPFDLFGWEGTADYDSVTTPNIASLVLLVQEGDKRVLLTGDNHPDMIMAGLRSANLVTDDWVHFDVLKFQHHGSEHNLTEEFALSVSADHYVFCGDGTHGNPELSVLKRVLASRLGPTTKLVRTPIAKDRPFHFWFSTSPATLNGTAQQKHMAAIMQWTNDMHRKYPDLFTAHFNTGLIHTIEV